MKDKVLKLTVAQLMHTHSSMLDHYVSAANSMKKPFKDVISITPTRIASCTGNGQCAECENRIAEMNDGTPSIT